MRQRDRERYTRRETHTGRHTQGGTYRETHRERKIGTGTGTETEKKVDVSGRCHGKSWPAGVQRTGPVFKLLEDTLCWCWHRVQQRSI